MTLLASLDSSAVTTASTSFEDEFLKSKSLANHTRVDFSPFLPLRSKVDCIVFRCRLADLDKGELKLIRAGVRDGHLKVPKDRKRWGGHGTPYLTVQDPSLHDLQYLVERFWNSKVIYVEFAVDAHLPPGSNELHLLERLKGQLRHCLFPQDHDRLPNAKRKYYNLGLKKYRADGLGTPLQKWQIIWEQTSVDDQLALYIKAKDDNKPINQPWVRMEARLEASGPSKAGLDRVGMFPHFAANLRTYLSPMFSLSNGFKNTAELVKLTGVPTDPWAKWGAQWSADGKAKLINDAHANNLIGSTLNDLRKSLMRLKPPAAVAHRYEEWIEEITV